MSKINLGANLMFARRTKTGIKPMFENEFETIASDIGSQTIVVRRANIRFAPTLVSDIGWTSITTIYPKTYDRLLMYKKSFIIYCLLFFCFFQMIACVQSPHLKEVNCPTPPQDNATYWYGSGKGKDINDARNVALQQIASKISVFVNSTFTSKQKEINRKFSAQVESMINVEIKDIHFPGYHTVKTEHLNNQCCVLVKVDKKKFLSEYRNKFEQANISIENEYHQLNAKNVFDMLKRKKKWVSLLEEARNIAGILFTFDYKGPQNIVNTRHMAFQNEINAKLDSAKVFIQYVPHAKYIAEHIKELLTEKNIQIVNSKTNDPCMAVINIDGQIKQKKFENEFIIRQSFNICLKTYSNKLLSQKNYSVFGVSLIGFDSAMKKASQSFYNDAKADGIFQILGI